MVLRQFHSALYSWTTNHYVGDSILYNWVIVYLYRWSKSVSARAEYSPMDIFSNDGNCMVSGRAAVSGYESLSCVVYRSDEIV